jgi:pimeloyl-ACP methyl ester carboxylesterase
MSASEEIAVPARNELPVPDGLAFVDEGSGPPIVLLHAFPLDGSMWTLQRERWRSRWRVIVPDLRGFGTSPATSGEPLSMADYARDVERLLDALSLETVCLCGLSMGGYVALAFAERFPERLAGLVLANTRAGADGEESRAARTALAARVERQGTGALVEALLDKLLGPQAPQEAIDRVRATIEAQDARGAISAITGMRERRDRTALLPAIRVPTLVIASAEDRLVPAAESRALVEAIPGANLIEIAGAGHLSNLEQPELFAIAAEAHFERLDWG